MPGLLARTVFFIFFCAGIPVVTVLMERFLILVRSRDITINLVH